MNHALVVGGTGMLSGVSLWLLDHDYHVSVIARNPERMKKLIEKASMESRMTPILVDYRNSKALRKNVQATIKRNGNIDLVAAWIHSNAKDALDIIANTVSIKNHPWELFHILGSSTDLDRIKRATPVPENCDYYQVRLGYVMEGTHSRWLTHQEISNGVIDAIKKREKISTIGQIEPWNKRP